MQKLRICFAGTPVFSAAHLSAIIDSEHEVVAVYTQPDRPAGRGKKLQASPVKNMALENGLRVLQPESLNEQEQRDVLEKISPDVLVVVAYGLILPKVILAIPKYACINVHASLLPRWRGAAPIERSLLSGDKETGVTIMKMDEGLDTGEMLYKRFVNILDSDTRVDLETKLMASGSKALLHCLNNLTEMLEDAEKQDDSLSCYADKLLKTEALIDWSKRSEFIERQIRAGIGRSPAYCFLDQKRLRILRADIPAEQSNNSETQCGTIIEVTKDTFTVRCLNSALRIYTVQLPGKNATGVGDLLNSKPSLFEVGKTFSDEPALEQ